MCVGGGTTINNALCLAPPGPVLDDWAQRGLDRAGLRDRDRRDPRVARRRAGSATRSRRHAARRFAAAAAELGLPGRGRGDGGQHHARLPWAPATATSAAPTGPRRRRSTPSCRGPSSELRARRCSPTREVEQIVLDGDRATGVVGPAPTASAVRRSMADEIVVAAGADRVELAAAAQRRSAATTSARGCTSTSTRRSRRTSRSRSTRSRGSRCRTPTGRPATRRRTSSRRGSTRRPRSRSRCRAGSTDHFENMRRYRHMACAGVLVGTTTPGRVKPGGDGPEIEYTAVGGRHALADRGPEGGRADLAAGRRRRA